MGTTRPERPLPVQASRLGVPATGSWFAVGFLAALGALLAYAAFQGARQIGSTLVILLLAGFLATGLNRLVVALTRHGVPRRVAVLIVVLGGFVAGALILLAVVPLAVDQIVGFVEALPGYVDTLLHSPAVARLNDQYHLDATLSSALSADSLAGLVGGVLGGAAAVAGSVFAAATVGILTLYFLVSYQRLVDSSLRLVPASRREAGAALVAGILERIGGYLVGAVFIALCAGTAAFVFLAVLGVGYAFVLALIVALLDLVPQIGATLGACVAAVAALSHSLPAFLATIAFFIVYQQLENWLIYPRVMRHAVRISNLAAILSVLVGGALAGVLGVLLAVPVCAAVQLVIRETLLPRQERR